MYQIFILKGYGQSTEQNLPLLVIFIEFEVVNDMGINELVKTTFTETEYKGTINGRTLINLVLWKVSDAERITINNFI